MIWREMSVSVSVLIQSRRVKRGCWLVYATGRPPPHVVAVRRRLALRQSRIKPCGS